MLKTKSIYIFVLLFCIHSGISSAQQVFPNTDLSKLTSEQLKNLSQNAQQEKTVIATVNIWDAKIISQDKGRLKIGFELANREQVQPGVKYGIQLVEKESEKERKLSIEYVYPDFIDLGENSRVYLEKDYEAPAYLKGEYELWVTAQNQNGLPLGQNLAGTITLDGTGEYLEINPENCYLNVKGDEKKTKYTLRQGVDIRWEEDLVGYCDIRNNFKTQITATPNYDTFFRTSFGKKIDSAKGEAITLDPDEIKTYSFVIPKQKDPQAYDVMLYFQNDQNQTISNSSIFHYVMHGESGTIQNVRLDKDYYQKGDTAKISLLWTGSADSFSNSRLGTAKLNQVQAEVKLTDSADSDCSVTELQNLESQQKPDYVNLDVPIIAECLNPGITVTLKDESGKILDSQYLTVESRGREKVNISDNKANSGTPNKTIALAVLIISCLTILALVLIWIKKRSSSGGIGGMKVLLFLLVAGNLIFFGKGVRADTFEGNDGGYAVFTINLNKATYSPGETIVISTSYYEYGIQCSNRYDEGQPVQLGVGDGKSSCSIPYNNCYISPEGWETCDPGEYSGIRLDNFSSVVNTSVSGYGASGSATSYYTASSSNGTHNLYFADYTFNDGSGAGCLLPGIQGTMSYTVACGDSSWTPDVSAYCTGIPFTQTSNCGNIRTAYGTANCCNAINGSCGAAATTYGAFASGFSGSLCNTGLAVPRPSFPAQGSSVSWRCTGYCGGLASPICTATRLLAANGSCGAAATTYPYTATSFSGAFCSSSGGMTPASVSFPNEGATATWTCLGTNGGSNSSCSAKRNACTPSYSGYYCGTTVSTGANCNDENDCGKTVTSTTPCYVSSDGCGHVNVVRPLQECVDAGKQCANFKNSCPACAGWKEMK